MLDQQRVEQLIGREAYSAVDQSKIGKIGQVYLDDSTGEPAWITVNTGLFGMRESFVPLQDAQVGDDRITLPFDKDKVKQAPNVDNDGHITPEEEQELYRYYGVDYQPWNGGDRDRYEGTDVTQGRGSLGTTTGEDSRTRTSEHIDAANTSGDAMTRSEERVEVGTRREERGRARLRKIVTTEQETVQVPVRKERAVLETEPITEGNVGDATSGTEIREDAHEVTLTEERPVVSTVATPVERVRLGTETVTDTETVTADVRKEHIEVEGDVDRR
jgi:uncharacterized protein (TIGR02271 family)